MALLGPRTTLCASHTLSAGALASQRRALAGRVPDPDFTAASDQPVSQSRKRLTEQTASVERGIPYRSDGAGGISLRYTLLTCSDSLLLHNQFTNQTATGF